MSGISRTVMTSNAVADVFKIHILSCFKSQKTSKQTPPFLALNAETGFCDLKHESIPSNKHRQLYAKSRFE